jgi:hypothetical protein
MLRKRPAANSHDKLAADLRKIHRPKSAGLCHECNRPWPCRSIRLANGEPATTGPLPRLPGAFVPPGR